MGMKHYPDLIKGFEKAWSDPEHPVYASKGNLVNFIIFLDLLRFSIIYIKNFIF